MDFLQRETTIKCVYYANLVSKLREAIKGIRRGMTNINVSHYM